LYHVAVPLQHESRPARRLAIALEPPGNLARELSLYRRTLFKSFGEASALAFPDIVFLSWSLPPKLPLASRRSPGRLASALDSCWIGVEGPFTASGIVSLGDSFLLGLGGPLRALAINAAEAAGRLGLEPDPAPPFEPGLGFFLLKPDGADGSADPSLAGEPLRMSFLDCSLALLRLDLGPDPFRAASWKLLARSRRRTGA
jgi:hypothetical protein